MSYFKIAILSIVFCLFLGCSNNKQFDWMIGDWIRTNEEEGKITKEHWVKESNERYKGKGYTIENNDTIFFEDLLILKAQGDWVLRVTGVHEQPMDFLITSFDSDTFVAENPENEFPKAIKYQRLYDKLRATVSNDEFSLDFYFDPID